MRAGLAPEKRQRILTRLTGLGEFPEVAQEAPAVQGSFDCETTSLREAVPSLRMTELIATYSLIAKDLLKALHSSLSSMPSMVDCMTTNTVWEFCMRSHARRSRGGSLAVSTSK